MSMISDLVDRLRVESKSMGRYGVDFMATLLMEASDTIVLLSEKARADIADMPKWIPCSERLPEREGRYLVTNSAWGSWTVDVCAWIGHWHSDDKPIAWIPLPKPYGEREGE